MHNAGYQDVLARPDRWLTDLQRQWLRPRGAFTRSVHRLLYFVNWLSVRILFRFSVEGSGHVPASGPLIIMPNHASPLDPQLLGAALPYTFLRQAYWAGKKSTVLKTWLRRTLSWYTRIIPISDDATALASAVKILDRGDILVWFPEGSRSLDGEVHEFKPGAAWLLTKCDVPIVPVYIHGAHAACRGSRAMPRLWTRVVVRIGPPRTAAQLGLKQATDQQIMRATDALRQSVLELRDESSSTRSLG